MVVTLLGMTMDVRLLQPQKALSPIQVTLLGITVLLQPYTSVFVPVSIMALQLSRLSYVVFPSSTMISSNAEQSAKILFPKDVTLFGILIDVRLLQPLNAYDSMAVTLLGIIVFLQPHTSVFVPVSIMALQLSRLSYVVFPSSTLISSNAGQLSKIEYFKY